MTRLQHVPTIEELARRACHMAEAMNIDFCITFPHLNAAPVLWRCVDQLLLPREFAHRLGEPLPLSHPLD